MRGFGGIISFNISKREKNIEVFSLFVEIRYFRQQNLRYLEVNSGAEADDIDSLMWTDIKSSMPGTCSVWAVQST